MSRQNGTKMSSDRRSFRNGLTNQQTRSSKYLSLFKCSFNVLTTYSFSVIFSFPGCILRPSNMNDGPHQAKAPVTNATHVKPNVDNMKDGFFDNSVSSLC